MGEEVNEEQTWKEKLLFYITAFFVLLGTFSLFAFLFLVPFVIEPAFTTIFMEFDETAAYCVTVDNEARKGQSNCSWSSCREGCTRDIYECTQIRVNYKRSLDVDNETVPFLTPATLLREERALRDYDSDYTEQVISYESAGRPEEDYASEIEPTGLMGNDSEWYYTGARLYPNVKGCGYPPMLNCTIFFKMYKNIGTNFSCYYSRVDPGIVINSLDMWQVYMNLVYAMAIPIPSFILSVIYLTYAYFKIYNEDEEAAPLEKNAEGMDIEGESGMTPADATPVQAASGALTPASEAFREDLASFGQHLKVAMADEMSRESFADAATPTVPNSISIPGNIGKMMATSISTTSGPIADI